MEPKQALLHRDESMCSPHLETEIKHLRLLFSMCNFLSMRYFEYLRCHMGAEIIGTRLVGIIRLNGSNYRNFPLSGYRFALSALQSVHPRGLQRSKGIKR